MSIGLVAVGEIDRNVIDWLKNDLSQVFNKVVFIGKGMPEPDCAFDQKRKQYSSTAILKAMMKQREYAPYEKILGVVDHDLFVPELNFVFGEASSKAAVISLTRLRQAFYRLPEDQPFSSKSLNRSRTRIRPYLRIGTLREPPMCDVFLK